METQNHKFFTPKFLEKELDILQSTEFNYSNIYKAFFDFTNNNSIEQYKRLLINNQNIDKTTIDNDNFSIIIPNFSKDFVYKTFKNFHININEKNQSSNNVIDNTNEENKDQVECCHQKKIKEKKDLNNIKSDNNEINPKFSLMGNLYKKTFSKIFGGNENPENKIEQKANSVFNKITKINNIDFNCDFFNIELKDNSNLTTFAKLKSKFINQYKKYDLFRYFLENKSATFNNKKKHLEINLNCNYLSKDAESQNMQSQMISQNNDDTTDDCFNLNSKLNKNYNFYQSKDAINKDNFNEIKDNNFSILLFKFVSKENEKNHTDSNTSFSNMNNINPEDEFVFIISVLEIANCYNTDRINKNEIENRLKNNDKKNTFQFVENKKLKLFTKVNFAIFNRNQLEKIDQNYKNKHLNKNLLKEFMKENIKITMFKDLLENFNTLLLSKIKTSVINTKFIREEEDSMLRNILSLENNYIIEKINNLPNLKSNTINLDLIDINVCKSNNGFNSNRSNNSETSLIDFEQINSNWIIEFNEELNNEYKFENDPEYANVKKMQALDLKKFDYYEIYLEMLKRLKDKLSADPTEIFGENELIRHIYGWRGDLEGCLESLLVMLDWRKTTKPETYSYEQDFAIYTDIPFKPLLQFSCEDIYGRQVLKLSPRFLNPKTLNVDLLCKYLIFVLETTCGQMKSYLDKFILFVDLKDVGYSNVSTEHLKMVNEFTRKYYVERLAKIYFINKGFLFSMIWAIVSKFMDERIHKKLVVIDKSHIASLKNLLGVNYDKIGINL